MRYICAMKLREWRDANSLSLRGAAVRFGIGNGKNPARRMQRIETGEAPVDAILADRIVSETGGAVSLKDLNDIRRGWLERGLVEAPAEALS